MVTLATLLLHRSLLPGYTLVPFEIIQDIAPWDHLALGPRANRLLIDPFFTFFPYRQLLSEAIRSGQLLLWNPYMFAGTPVFGDPNFQPFYPFNLLGAIFFSSTQALPWIAWFHLTVTGLLTFLFLRRHDLRWLACVLGGGIWLLNGYTVVWLENPHRLSTAAWIPGIFWAFEVATQEKKPAWAVISGFFLGLAILGGQVQFIFITIPVMALYAILKTWSVGWRSKSSAEPQRPNAIHRSNSIQSAIRPLVYLMITVLIGVGIGAIILLPALEFSALSHRALSGSGGILETRWPAKQLITLLAPDFFGNPSTEVRYWGSVNYAEVTVYFGAASLFVALTSPIMARRRPLPIYALILTVVILALALGTPLARLLSLLPGARFIALRRTMFLIPLFGSWLAATGLDGWLVTLHSRRRRILAAGFAFVGLTFLTVGPIINLNDMFSVHKTDALPDLIRGVAIVSVSTVFLFYSKRRPQLVGAAIVLVAFIDLLSWGRGFNPITSTAYRYPENGVVDFLRQDDGLFRVLPLQSGKLVFGPNILSQFDLQDVTGYSSLIKKEYVELVKSMDDQVTIDWMAANDNMLVMSHFHPMVSLLNVKYVLSAHELANTDVEQLTHDGCDETRSITGVGVTQTFVASKPGLYRVDVGISDNGVEGQGGLEFWIWRGGTDGELITHLSAEQSDVQRSGRAVFRFEPLPDSAGVTFTWRMRSDYPSAICLAADGTPSFAAYSRGLQYVDTLDGVWVYENPNALPRAYFVHHARVSDKSRSLIELHRPDFDWYQSVLLADPLPAEQLKQLSEEPIASRGSARVSSYSPQRVDILVDTPEAGMLVLADTFYPGWQATLDGEPVTIHEANHTFRSLFVPPGQHEVRFVFAPTSLRWGASIALLALLVGIALIWSYRSRSPKHVLTRRTRPGSVGQDDDLAVG